MGNTAESEGVVSSTPGIRASLAEVLVLVLVVAFGVNLVSTVLAAWLPQWLILSIGGALTLGAVAYVSFARLKPVHQSTRIEGFLVIDTEANELLAVPQYDLPSSATAHLAAAFAENPALRRQWDAEPPIDMRDAVGTPNLGQKLLNELVEYLLIERLSTTLTDHFNDSAFSKGKLREYRRADLPDILLQNRFLELFSRDPKDREGFEDMTSGSEEGWEVVAGHSESGAYYSRFDLTLPANSDVRRDADGNLRITSRHLDVCLAARFLPYGGPAPFAMMSFYLGECSFDVQDYLVEFDIDVKIQRRLLLKREALAYSLWIEDVLKALGRDFSGQRFVDDINWPTLEAAIQVFERNERGQSRRDSGGRHQGGATVAKGVDNASDDGS